VLNDLLPNPLHPAVVHLPIALTVLVPVFAIGALVAIRRGTKVLRAWGIAAAMLAALSLSAWVSLETGEQQEDRVESIVPERAFETHEEAAEAFFMLSLGVLGVAGLGLLGGRVGTGARYAAALGTLALVVAGYNVGHSGGALVYTHGAASAYTSSSGTMPAAANGGEVTGSQSSEADDDH
jgi:formate hydrogenlyase subunit 3/multisubunit Na+/H+ antiporter MnhD subunit